jgi:hypothetical protein
LFAVPAKSDTKELIMTHKLFTTVCALGLLASGCASPNDNDYDYDPGRGGVYGARQEGNIDAAPGRDVREPYTPVMGDTTGDGLPRDRRTGGGITGQDVTPSERIENNEKTRSNDGTRATGGSGAVPQ